MLPIFFLAFRLITDMKIFKKSENYFKKLGTIHEDEESPIYYLYIYSYSDFWVYLGQFGLYLFLFIVYGFVDEMSIDFEKEQNRRRTEIFHRVLEIFLKLIHILLLLEVPLALGLVLYYFATIEQQTPLT